MILKKKKKSQSNVAGLSHALLVKIDEKIH